MNYWSNWSRSGTTPITGQGKGKGKIKGNGKGNGKGKGTQRIWVQRIAAANDSLPSPSSHALSLNPKSVSGPPSSRNAHSRNHTSADLNDSDRRAAVGGRARSTQDAGGSGSGVRSDLIVIEDGQEDAWETRAAELGWTSKDGRYPGHEPLRPKSACHSANHGSSQSTEYAPLLFPVSPSPTDVPNQAFA